MQCHPPLLTHLEVVKVVGAPPAYPPTLMANPPPLLLHTWLLLGTSTYQVGHGCAAWDAARLLVSLHIFAQAVTGHTVGETTQ